MLVVIALGGNALLRRGQPLDATVQRANAKVAAEVIAEIPRDHQVVLTHGNGPQVGLLALQNDAYEETRPYPLDILDAESEGMVGYVLEQELGRRIPPSRLATLLTQVVVSSTDIALGHPTKPVGPTYGWEDADRLAKERGWAIAQDGHHWRRVVPSPEPKRIVELRAIQLLVDAGLVVICAGGGGVPVVELPHMGTRGVEAVIDKDLSAALLATQLGADALLLLTDVDGVYDGWGTSEARAIRSTSVAELRALDAPAGSMGPKVEAVCRFIDSGGRLAAIGALDNAVEMLAGQRGTVLRGS